jgi:hypothetical protein
MYKNAHNVRFKKKIYYEFFLVIFFQNALWCCTFECSILSIHLKNDNHETF